MAERLTGKSYRGFYLKDDFGGRIYCDDNKETINAYYGQPLITKLGKLEDILEKYGIESVEELDKKLAYYIDKIDLEAENEYLKKAIEKQNRVSKSISKDRDTWKRACELALKEGYYAEKEYYIGEPPTQEEYVRKQSNFFYQQAKKEGK